MPRARPDRPHPSRPPPPDLYAHPGQVVRRDIDRRPRILAQGSGIAVPRPVDPHEGGAPIPGCGRAGVDGACARWQNTITFPVHPSTSRWTPTTRRIGVRRFRTPLKGPLQHPARTIRPSDPRTSLGARVLPIVTSHQGATRRATPGARARTAELGVPTPESAVLQDAQRSYTRGLSKSHSEERVSASPGHRPSLRPTCTDTITLSERAGSDRQRAPNRSN